MNNDFCIPDIYRPKKTTDYVESKDNLNLWSEHNIKTYIDSYLTTKQSHFEIFDHEDIKVNLTKCMFELQNKIDECVKKTGDIVSGSLQVTKNPTTCLDVVNKEYVDRLYQQHKEYVDRQHQNIQCIFSKGQNIAKKTFFFNPGFICPRQIHIISVGFSTSPYKYKIGEKIKISDVNPTKLYFLVNNEIKSQYVIEKDIQLGHILKEFKDPIVFEKEDNIMMVVETTIEDTSITLSFY
jgi:hypothetical protein